MKESTELLVHDLGFRTGYAKALQEIADRGDVIVSAADLKLVAGGGSGTVEVGAARHRLAAVLSDFYVDEFSSKGPAFAVCPNCEAQYPTFHSPVGSLHTLCDDCGWTSDEAASDD